MPCGRKIPKFKTKGDAYKHGIITYGEFYVRRVKGGWKAYKKKKRKRKR